MVAKWSRLDWAQRRVLFEATWNLAAALLAIRLLPFRWIAARLGSPLKTSGETRITVEQRKEAQLVGWAITTMTRYIPWDAKCLAQAVAGKWMLHRRRLPSTFILGVDRVHEGDKWLEAHAWLRCGPDTITGERQHERFKVLATFTEERF